MMNTSLTRSALKPMALSADLRRCRSLLAAPMKSTVVGSSAFLVRMLTKMMSTAANGKIPVILKPMPKYTKDRKFDIDNGKRCRSDMQVRDIFETWIVYFSKTYDSDEEKERKYTIFKLKVRFIEEMNFNMHKLRMRLDYFSDMTCKEYFALKDQDQIT